MTTRRQADHRQGTRRIRIGNVTIGGGSPVAVQSMCNTMTRDARATIRQIHALEEAGCEIVRVAVPDREAAERLGDIRRKIHIPLVADIHFDYRLALESVRQGVDKLRINPGNIGAAENVAAVVKAAKRARIPVRIGVNAGSLKAVHRDPVADRRKEVARRAKILVAAAMEHVGILEKHDFEDIAISLKASDIPTTVAAYRLMAATVRYPLHLGITEAGSMFRGTIKSSAGLGILLNDGIGDTVRVSLTADPVEEVRAAYQLLQSMELRSTGIELISCPTCSRCAVDLISIVDQLERKLDKMHDVTRVFKDRPLKVAVMGCVVNGPGEARDADIGIAGGKGKGVLFRNGKALGSVPPRQWVTTLLKMIQNTAKGRK